jgi:hypothetical protein
MEKTLKDAFRAKAEALRSRPAEHTRLCVNLINAYWRERGFDAQCVKEEGNRVVSNMIDGIPTVRLPR